MSDIIIKKVNSKKDLKRFIEFNYELYKGNPYAVPDLYLDLANTLSSKNAATEFCDFQPFLALRDNKVVGRIVGIINRKANKTWNLNSVRFGWIDFIDDRAVSKALIEAVENWGREHGMTTLQGPLGFTDMDPEGLLTEGFDELGTMATAYHYPYYKEHLEALGLEKDADWIEMKMNVPKEVPERLVKVAEMVMQRYGVSIRKFKTASQLRDAFGQEIFSVINEAFKPLFGYSELSKKQIDQYVSLYLNFIDPKLVSTVVDKNGKLIGVGITMPSIVEALQKSKGKLFPMGWYHLLKALKWKHSDHIEMMLIAVLPEWQRKGVNAIFFYDLLPYYINGGYKWVETNVELEHNDKVQSQWQFFDPRIHKRRRCYKKALN